MSGEPAGNARGGWSGPLALATALLLAAAYSILRKGYQFDGVFADDQFWNALIVDRLHPGMLANDPLVALIRDGYRSGLFALMTPLASAIELPTLSLLFFVVARTATCVAIFALARTLTGSAATGITSAFLIAGAWISYFGGVNFVETILTPRGFALPLGLFALDAWLRRRPAAFGVWLAACVWVHPVTGVNLFGVAAFCEAVFRRGAPARRGFGATLAALAALLLWIGLRSGRLGADGEGLRFDDAWFAIVVETVGPWVLLHRLPADFAVACLWVPALGVIGAAAAAPPRLRAAMWGFGAAGGVALVLHAVCVDGLHLRAALQLAPQRATLPFVAVAVVAVAHWSVVSLRHADPARRWLAAAFLAAAVLLRDTGPAIVLGGLLALAWWVPRPAPGTRARAAAALASIAAVLALAAPSIRQSFHLRPAHVADVIGRLAARGVDEDWARVQRFIRDHSAPGDAVMAPPALSPRVFALRPSTLRMKMQSFTYWSREYAVAFDDWRREIGIPLRTADAPRALELARRSGARWLVLDGRAVPTGPNDPPPAFAAGPYRAYPVADRPAR